MLKKVKTFLALPEPVIILLANFFCSKSLIGSTPAAAVIHYQGEVAAQMTLQGRCLDLNQRWHRVNNQS